MKNERKTKAQLIKDLEALRSRILELEKAETELVRAKSELEASEERYARLVDTVPDVIVHTDLVGNILFINDYALQISGYSRKEFLGENILRFVPPEEHERLLMNITLMMDSRLGPKEYNLIMKDGRIVPFEVNGDVLRDKEGKPFGIVNVCRDISRRRHEEERTRQSEEKFSTIFMTAPDCITITRMRDGLIVDVNAVFEETIGWKREESVGKTSLEMNFWVDPSDRDSMVGELSAGRDVMNREFLFRRRDGAVRSGMYSARTFNLAGEPCIIFMLQDITRRKETERTLRENEERLRGITMNLPGVVYQFYAKNNGEYGISHASGRMTKIFGIAEDVESMFPEFVTHIHEEDRDRFASSLRKAVEKCESWDFEGRFVRPSGEILWFHGLSTPTRHEDRLVFDGIILNVTERKRVEDALRNSEEKFRKMTEASNVGIAIIDGERFIYVNPMTRKMSGFSEEEYLSRPMLDFVTPESKELIRRRAMARLEGKPVPERYEFSVLTKDGGIRWAEAGAAVIEYNGKPATIFTIYDITDRKAAEAEREALQARLNSAQKMEALGRLAGGVAHDLNNVLGALSGYSELLLLEIPEGQKARSHVERILQSTEKAAAIIQDLLTLARRGVSSSDVMNLNDLVSGFLKTAVFEKIREFHPRVTFRTQCQDGLLNIRGSLVHLEKTLMNLVSNAAESIDGEGEVAIRTENRYLDKPVRGYDEIREGDYAILTVSDTGVGIPAEDMARIFEPFYTKKTMGRSGTGLGLAIVWGTVKDQNGYIDVQTRIGEGTVFTLYFPVTREELTTPRQEVPLEQYIGSGESVLVVDDIAEQREVASGLLKRIGYQVHTVSSGEEAVEYLRGNRADILVLDMIMDPGIDGLETYRRILDLHPGQKAILVSGFSETDRVREAQRLGAGVYVRKPYVMEKIGMAIRAELGRPFA